MDVEKDKTLGLAIAKQRRKMDFDNSQLEMLFPQRLHFNTVIIIYMVEKQSMKKKKKKSCYKLPIFKLQSIGPVHSSLIYHTWYMCNPS